MKKRKREKERKKERMRGDILLLVDITDSPLIFTGKKSSFGVLDIASLPVHQIIGVDYTPQMKVQ
jgi:hypothetical protein